MTDNAIRNLARLIVSILWGLAACAALTLLVGCRSVKYVPIETVKTERVEVHDSIHITDTVRVSVADTTTVATATILQKVDSAYLATLGIINAPPEAWLLQTTTATHTSHTADTQATHTAATAHAADSVRIEYHDRPYPVEKPLARWQQFFITFGRYAAGAAIVLLALAIVWIIRRVNGKT